MGKFFQRNIGSTGRIARGMMAGVLLVAGAGVAAYLELWLGVRSPLVRSSCLKPSPAGASPARAG